MSSNAKLFRTIRRSVTSGIALSPDVVSAAAVFGNAYDENASGIVAEVLDQDLLDFMEDWGISADTLVEDFLSNRIGGAGRRSEEYLGKTAGSGTTLIGKFLRHLRDMRGPLTGQKLAKLVGASSFKVRALAAMYAKGRAAEHIVHPAMIAMIAAGREAGDSEYMRVTAPVRGLSAASAVSAATGVSDDSAGLSSAPGSAQTSAAPSRNVSAAKPGRREGWVQSKDDEVKEIRAVVAEAGKEYKAALLGVAEEFAENAEKFLNSHGHGRKSAQEIASTIRERLTAAIEAKPTMAVSALALDAMAAMNSRRSPAKQLGEEDAKKIIGYDAAATKAEALRKQIEYDTANDRLKDLTGQTPQAQEAPQAFAEPQAQAAPKMSATIPQQAPVTSTEAAAAAAVDDAPDNIDPGVPEVPVMPDGGGETIVDAADRLPGKFREVLMVDPSDATDKRVLDNWGYDDETHGLYGDAPVDSLQWSAQMDGVLSAIRPVAYGPKTRVPGHLDAVTMPASWAKSRDILIDRTRFSKAREIKPVGGTNIATFASDLVRKSGSTFNVPTYNFAGQSSTMSAARARVLEQMKKPLRCPGTAMDWGAAESIPYAVVRQMGGAP